MGLRYRHVRSTINISKQFENILIRVPDISSVAALETRARSLARKAIYIQPALTLRTIRSFQMHLVGLGLMYESLHTVPCRMLTMFAVLDMYCRQYLPGVLQGKPVQ